MLCNAIAKSAFKVCFRGPFLRDLPKTGCQSGFSSAVAESASKACYPAQLRKAPPKYVLKSRFSEICQEPAAEARFPDPSCLPMNTPRGLRGPQIRASTGNDGSQRRPSPTRPPTLRDRLEATDLHLPSPTRPPALTWPPPRHPHGDEVGTPHRAPGAGRSRSRPQRGRWRRRA